MKKDETCKESSSSFYSDSGEDEKAGGKKPEPNPAEPVKTKPPLISLAHSAANAKVAAAPSKAQSSRGKTHRLEDVANFLENQTIFLRRLQDD